MTLSFGKRLFRDKILYYFLLDYIIRVESGQNSTFFYTRPEPTLVIERPSYAKRVDATSATNCPARKLEIKFRIASLVGEREWRNAR